MRIRTLLLVALGAMGLTSLSVWNLTPVNAGDTKAAASRIAVAPSDSELPEPVPDRASFVAGQTLQLEGRLGHARLAAGSDQTTYVLGTITGAEHAAAPAAALDLAIVIDTSGSMRGMRLQNAVEAARGMVRRLRDHDRVTVIAYNARARVVVPPTFVDAVSRSRVAAQVGGIRADGATCISCGLDLALAHRTPALDRVSRILLLSDGEATQGIQSERGFRSLARRALGLGTSVSTVGVDLEYNERIMGALAQVSNGRHYFVERPAQLPPVFDQELESVARSVANGVELEVELAEGVRVERIFDREARNFGNRLVVPVGAIAPGETKTFLVQVRVPSGHDPEREVARMQLRYQDLVQGVAGRCEGQLALRTTEVASEVSQLDPFVAARLSRSVTLAGIREANLQSSRGDFARARRTLASTRDEVATLERGAMEAAGPRRPSRLSHDFDAQNQALGRAIAGADDPGLRSRGGGGVAAPARRRAERQRRVNEDLVNPFAR